MRDPRLELTFQQIAGHSAQSSDPYEINFTAVNTNTLTVREDNLRGKAGKSSTLSGVFVSRLSLTLFDGDDLIKRALIIYANDEVAH